MSKSRRSRSILPEQGLSKRFVNVRKHSHHVESLKYTVVFHLSHFVGQNRKSNSHYYEEGISMRQSNLLTLKLWCGRNTPGDGAGTPFIKGVSVEDVYGTPAWKSINREVLHPSILGCIILQ